MVGSLHKYPDAGSDARLLPTKAGWSAVTPAVRPLRHVVQVSRPAATSPGDSKLPMRSGMSCDTVAQPSCKLDESRLAGYARTAGSRSTSAALDGWCT